MPTTINPSGQTITQYNVQSGAALNLLNNIAPPATSGIPLVSQGVAAQPIFSTVGVAGGGTGVTTFTPYAVITGGTTATGPLQNVSGVGSSGQILTSNGASALPTWQTGSGGTGTFNCTTVTLTSAQVKALRATPITVVAAQGAGVWIIPLMYAAKLIYGGTNAFSNGQSLGLFYASGSDGLFNVVNTGTQLNVTTDKNWFGPSVATVQAPLPASVENQDLQIKNTGGSEITGNAANNNTFKITVWWTSISM